MWGINKWAKEQEQSTALPVKHRLFVELVHSLSGNIYHAKESLVQGHEVTCHIAFIAREQSGGVRDTYWCSSHLPLHSFDLVQDWLGPRGQSTYIQTVSPPLRPPWESSQRHVRGVTQETLNLVQADKKINHPKSNLSTWHLNTSHEIKTINKKHFLHQITPQACRHFMKKKMHFIYLQESSKA